MSTHSLTSDLTASLRRRSSALTISTKDEPHLQADSSRGRAWEGPRSLEDGGEAGRPWAVLIPHVVEQVSSGGVTQQGCRGGGEPLAVPGSTQQRGAHRCETKKVGLPTCEGLRGGWGQAPSAPHHMLPHLHPWRPHAALPPLRLPRLHPGPAFNP